VEQMSKKRLMLKLKMLIGSLNHSDEDFHHIQYILYQLRNNFITADQAYKNVKKLGVKLN